MRAGCAAKRSMRWVNHQNRPPYRANKTIDTLIAELYAADSEVSEVKMVTAPKPTSRMNTQKARLRGWYNVTGCPQPDS